MRCHNSATCALNRPKRWGIRLPTGNSLAKMLVHSCIPTAGRAAQLSSIKPSALTLPSPPPAVTPTATADLTLTLPDLPAPLKAKILALEVLGIDAGRALALNPALRLAPLDALHTAISFLLSKGIHHKDLPRIVGMCPGVLTASPTADLAPVFAFLARDLSVPESDFRRVVNKCPRLLAVSVRGQLKPALIYLQKLGFADLRALAYQEPVLLVSSVERTLMPKLEFIEDMGMSREEAVGMVLRSPSLFTFSIERNFRPKFDYFVGEMGGRVEELREFPQYFGFSLEKRIKVRHRELTERGVRLPLAAMLRSSDEEFMEMMAKMEVRKHHLH